MTAGYSGTPLAKKLGIKEGFAVLGINTPDDYPELLRPLPENVSIENAEARASARANHTTVDLIHLFTNSRDELFRELAKRRSADQTKLLDLGFVVQKVRAASDRDHGGRGSRSRIPSGPGGHKSMRCR